jgi:hypothetical protein
MQQMQSGLSQHNSFAGPSFPKQQTSLKDLDKANFETPVSLYLSNTPSKNVGVNNQDKKDRNDKQNKSVEYLSLDHERRGSSMGINQGHDDSYDPFVTAGNRKQTTRKQRLYQKEDNLPQINTSIQPHRNVSNASIYFPGQINMGQGTREKNHDFTAFRNQDRSNNKSTTEHNPNTDNNQLFRATRIKEALNDHSRDSVEQSRYFNRLEKSNRRQSALFKDHYNKYIIPSTMKIHEKINRDQDRMVDAQRRMEHMEIEQNNDSYTLKKEYNEVLQNQIAERKRFKDQEIEEKARAHEHNAYKSKMYEDEKLHQRIEKKREQQELHNILSNQSMYKFMVPTSEPVTKPYVDNYETNAIDKMYSIGGFDVKKPHQNGKSRRQNTYIEPNTITNPMNGYNNIIREHIKANKHKFATGSTGKSIFSNSAQNNLSY